MDTGVFLSLPCACRVQNLLFTKMYTVVEWALASRSRRATGPISAHWHKLAPAGVEADSVLHSPPKYLSTCLSNWPLFPRERVDWSTCSYRSLANASVCTVYLLTNGNFLFAPPSGTPSLVWCRVANLLFAQLIAGAPFCVARSWNMYRLPGECVICDVDSLVSARNAKKFFLRVSFVESSLQRR